MPRGGTRRDGATCRATCALFAGSDDVRMDAMGLTFPFGKPVDLLLRLLDTALGQIG